MKAVGYQKAGPLDRADALVDIGIETPKAAGHDLLVAVKAISVNPVDYKVRRRASAEPGQWKVLGWDVSGEVVAVGDEVALFKPGDEVFYAGSIARAGANSEFHLVDERIVGHKPSTLTHAQAAAMPLTSITAWEMLFDRLCVNKAVPGAAKAILVVGGAGGVASMAIQLARALTDLTVIATASRPETQQWVQDRGAHHMVDHSRPMADQVAKLGIGAPAFVFSTTHTDQHADEIAKLLAPQGRLGLIDDPEHFTVNAFKSKSISVHWESMFTRSVFGTVDIAQQGRLLNDVAKLVDQGKIRTTLKEVQSPICAATIRKAHALLESGKSIGKLVIEGF